MEEVEELSLEDLRRKLQRREEDAPYLRAIDDVVRRRLHGDTPCELLPELLLSNWAEADKPAELAQAWQVTHVFSCIEGTYLSREAAIERYAAAGITYDGVAAEDDEEYSMLPRHFARFRSFVAPLRRRREAGGAGRCLVHCAGGMNRSGVLAVAYAMESRRWPLLDAVAHCAGARGPILWNAGFQQELVDFARENDLLVERQQQRRHEEQEEKEEKEEQLLVSVLSQFSKGEEAPRADGVKSWMRAPGALGDDSTPPPRRRLEQVLEAVERTGSRRRQNGQVPWGEDTARRRFLDDSKECSIC